MTVKKETILNTALKMFAKNGYINTSTSAIAKEAGVSEGLIFRHFGSKEGLLDSIVNKGIEEMEKQITPLLEESDPAKALSLALDFVLHSVRDMVESWQLQMSLKYQSPEIARKYHESDIMKRLNDVLENAFRKMKYPNPKSETKLFTLILGMLFSVLHDEDEIEQEAFISFLKSKYNIR